MRRGRERKDIAEKTLWQTNKEPCYQLTTGNDQPNTIKRHLRYTSAGITVDKILSTGPENDQLLRLQPNSDFNCESQYCSAIHLWQSAISGGRCGPVFPEHPVHLTPMCPPYSLCRAFLWRHPAQPTWICHRVHITTSLLPDV